MRPKWSRESEASRRTGWLASTLEGPMLRSTATRSPGAATGLAGAASALELVTSGWVCDAAGGGGLPTDVVGGTVAGTAGDVDALPAR
jgi:hypothetical protein